MQMQTTSPAAHGAEAKDSEWPAGLKWRVLSVLMSTAGRAAGGIDLGYRRGFDSGEMLDYVYENRASGKLLVGALIDRAYLNAIGWRAIRARKELLKTVLRHEIEAQRAESTPVVVLDVAAGPGRYLLETCREMGLGSELQVVCRDLDVGGQELGRARAQAMGLSNVRYETGDALDPRWPSTSEPGPDIVVVSGLYELFTDPAPIQQSMRGIYNILKPGGKLVFTTQVSHPQLEMIANVLVNREGEPWVMVCRSIEEAEALAREANFHSMQSQVEPNGLFSVTACRKGAGKLP